MASSYDDEIVVALTAQTAELEAGMAKGAATVKAMGDTVAQEAAAFNAAVQSKVDAMVRLNAAFSGNVASAEGMASAESALDEAMNAGAITAAEYAGYVARLDAAEAAAASTATAATAALVEQRVAVGLNNSAIAELGRMLGEVLRGNYGQLERSSVTLASRTGLLASAMNALLSPMGMVAIAAAALGYSIFEAGQQFEHMEGTVLATGGAAGYTAGQLVGMADRIGETTGSIGNAEEAIQRLALSGRFAGRDLQLVATAAADMAALTGESIQSCVAQIERLQEDPLKAVAKLNDQFHFLTVSQYEQMESLAKAGDTMGAASIAYEAMADKMQGRTDTLTQHANVLVSALRDIKTVWSESMQEIDHALGGGDDAYGLNEAKQLLSVLQKQEAQAKETGSSALPGIRLEIQRQQQVVDQLTAKFDATAKSAQKVGQAAQDSAAQIDAMSKKSKVGSATRDLEQELRTQEADQQISYDKREAFEADYWQKVLADSQKGSAEYIAAWQRVQSTQQQMDRQQAESWREAQRQRNEASKRAAAEAINDLQIEREQTQAASAERIAVDAKTMDKVVELYGRDSAEFKRALAQRLSDTKAYVSAYLAEQKRAEAEDEKAYKSENEAAIKAVNETFGERAKGYQEQLRLHQITGSQEIALLRQNADQQYQIDLGILDHYKELMADKPEVVEEINKQIRDLERQHNQQMAQINNEALAQETATWNARLQPITNAFNQSINGMIQGTQTLQQGVARMLQSILLSYIQTILRTKEEWLAGELAKLTMTQQTAAEQTTTLAAQRAANDAADRVSAVASVARASGVAGANGLASFAQAPWPIDTGAPAFGASMAAAAAGYSSVASAAGGWDRVPFDDAPALLHRNEMVLPAHLADNVRNMSSGGGGGSSTQNIHVHANDAKSFAAMLHADPRAFAKAAQRAMQVTRRR